MTTLVDLPACSRAVVMDLPHSRGLARRLIALGLTPGAEVRVLQNWGRCPLIIETHGARLALGRGQAARVTVEPLPDGEGDSACLEDGSYPGDE
ncbi:MAG: ferrous iron transport protein A [Actinomycetia bacterium]|nr:ferrous iron transport protein A [Actinomycetes bacterium]